MASSLGEAGAADTTRWIGEGAKSSVWMATVQGFLCTDYSGWVLHRP
jgi:hypothetical protein